MKLVPSAQMYLSVCRFFRSDFSQLYRSVGARYLLLCISGLLAYLHQYADDCQVYISVPVTEAAAAVDRFSRCVADVSMWLSSSRLRLNPAKTVVIGLGGRQQVTNITVDSIPVLSSIVTTVASARDLGIVVDSQLTMSANVSSTCRSAYYQFRQLLTVRQRREDGCPGVRVNTPGLLQQSHVRYC